MQIKLTIRYHLTMIRMAINKSKNNKCCKDVENGEPLCTVGGSADWCTHCGKQYRVISKIKKMELPYYLVIPLLVNYLKTPKTLIQKNIYTHMFI